jgi:hypothetical protein
VSSKVAAAFGIDTAPGAVIDGSTAERVGQRAERQGRGQHGEQQRCRWPAPTSRPAPRCNPTQASFGGGGVALDTQAFAPASVSGSTVSIANNSNTALGVINDVSNTVTVTGGTSGAGGFGIPAVVLQGPVPNAARCWATRCW